MIRNLGAQDRIPGVQKAAILLVLLGEEISAEVLRQLSAQEVEQIAKEVAQLGSITEEVAQKVLQECHEMRLAHHYLVKGGLEYAEKLLVKAFGPEKGRRLVEQLAARLGAELTSLEALRRFDPQQLAKFLHQEHPQTIALVLSHLTPGQAATLLASLPEELRADVALRMAHLDQISPEVVQKIGAVIGQKMKALGEISRETYGGVQAVADIMNQLDATTSKEVLEKIEERDPKLA
ncbi:MAG: flagellar motor switch protein FliG, partial [Thermoleophilia bacterium]|nr:flagellar motor switch protein FliG [Thermoleophilia bacterium]